jgi:hypothetical protein
MVRTIMSKGDGTTPRTIGAANVAFEFREVPEFSWSISRQRLLEQCPRAYFYRYYLSHNGWLREASTDSRTAYRLSKLTTLDQLLGQQIDRRAYELEEAARSRATLPSADALEERTLVELRKAWVSSERRRAEFEAHPKNVVMLRAIYLGQDTAREVERMKSKVGTCLSAIRALSHWERLREAGDAGRLEIPQFAHFHMGELKVYAAPDLAYVHGDVLHVIDWKSGREESSNEEQVQLEARYLLETDPSLVCLGTAGHLEYLLSATSQAIDCSQTALESVGQTVALGVAKMSALLREESVNEPLEQSAFERTPSGLCKTCNYSPLCESHG